MFKSLNRVVYQVSDIEKGKQWYKDVLGSAPVFEAPFAVIFLIGASQLVLAPHASSKATVNGSAIAYWGVDDAAAAYQRMLQLGATPHSEVNTVFGTRTASVTDPFGNVLGLRGTEVDKAKASVEHRPSESAKMVAWVRALAAMDDREGIRCPDNLAEIFITEEQRSALKNPAVRKWMKTTPPGMYEYAIARTAFFDRVVKQALVDKIPQIVFLGAGYDSRPYRFRDHIRHTRIFEVDAPPTQSRKRDHLRRAEIAIPEQVTFVAVNFMTDNLKVALANAGYDTAARTLFVWEGVTFYLPPGAVDDTFSFIKADSGAGSMVCFDCSVSGPDGLNGYGVKELREAMKVSFPGEAVLFDIEEGKIESFLSDRGFTVIERLDSKDMEKNYLSLPDGSSAGRVTEMFNFVYAKSVE